MRRVPIQFGCLVAAIAFSACQTTGDPTQGGLFGWSQAKARQRIADREATLASEQENMRTEQQREASLRGTVRTNAEALAAQQRELGELLANAEALEQEAPTPAAASRARRLHRGIERVRQNTGFTVDERWSMLRDFAQDVERLRVDWAQSSAAQTPR